MRKGRLTVAVVPHAHDSFLTSHWLALDASRIPFRGRGQFTG